MTYVIDPEMAELIDKACRVVTKYGRGMVVNMLTEEAHETAEIIRSMDGDGEAEIDTEYVVSAQTVLRLASRVAANKTDNSMDRQQFKKKADWLGSSIWGSHPKTEPTEIKVQE